MDDGAEDDAVPVQNPRKKYIVSRKFDRRSASQMGNRKSSTSGTTPLNSDLYMKHG